MQPAAPDEGRIPHQLDVFFSEFPTINCQKLQDFINRCDPDEPDSCEVSEVSQDSSGPVKLHSWLATLGDFNMTIMAHDAPSPASHVIDEARLPGGGRAELKDHKSFALLTNIGGEGYAHYEAEIFL